LQIRNLQNLSIPPKRKLKMNLRRSARSASKLARAAITAYGPQALQGLVGSGAIGAVARSAIKSMRSPAGRSRPSRAGFASGQGVSLPTTQALVSGGPRFRWGPAVHGNEHGVKLHGEQLWCDIKSGASGLAALSTQNSANIQTLYFDPNNINSLPSPLTTLGSMFTRYCLRKCRVKYVPSTGSSVSVGVAFQVNTDAANINVTSGTYDQLQQSQNSKAGPVWSFFDLDVPCDGELRYIGNSTTSGSITVPERRQDCAFAITGYFDTAVASTLYGNLRIEYEIDLFELAPLTTENGLRLLRAPKCRKAHPDDFLHFPALSPEWETKEEKTLASSIRHEEKVRDEVKASEPDSPVLVSLPLAAPTTRPAMARGALISQVSALEVPRGLFRS
jgi:hypothetical protein